MDDSGLRLVVFDVERIETFPLPRRGQIHIGRSFDCEVRLDHASVSRRHARVTIAENITLEDLESSAGTSVRGRSIAAGTPVTLSPGEAIELGGLTAMVQRRPYARRVANIVEFGYFMQRVDIECRRALAVAAPLALVRVRVEMSGPAVEEALVSALRGTDLVGHYAPGEYLIALVDTPAHRVPEVLHRLRRRLESGGVRIHFGSALNPRDGQHAHALLEQACIAIAGVARAPASPVIEAPATRHLHGLLEQEATNTGVVYLYGAPGTGKTFLAERLHRLSPRRHERLERVDAATVGAGELASQLETALARAQRGTLLIESMTAASSLAREHVLRAIARAARDGVRVIITGDAPLDDLPATSLFVPPLAARQGEIEPLARSFLRAIYTRERRVREPRCVAGVYDLLRAHEWTGNLTELRNVIERAAMLASDEIGPSDLPIECSKRPAPTASPPPPANDRADGLRDVLDDYERRRILEVLQRCAGNQTRAARALGISRRTLVTRLSEWGMTRRRAS